jgi:hypothetical protein
MGAKVSCSQELDGAPSMQGFLRADDDKQPPPYMPACIFFRLGTVKKDWKDQRSKGRKTKAVLKAAPAALFLT